MPNSASSNGLASAPAAPAQVGAVVVGGAPLTLKDFRAVLYDGRAISLAPAAVTRVEASYEFLKKFSTGKLIYGINTGFGPMAQYKIGDADLHALQLNLIRSH